MNDTAQMFESNAKKKVISLVMNNRTYKRGEMKQSEGDMLDGVPGSGMIPRVGFCCVNKQQI